MEGEDGNTENQIEGDRGKKAGSLLREQQCTAVAAFGMVDSGK